MNHICHHRPPYYYTYFVVVIIVSPHVSYSTIISSHTLSHTLTLTVFYYKHIHVCDLSVTVLCTNIITTYTYILVVHRSFFLMNNGIIVVVIYLRNKNNNDMLSN